MSAATHLLEARAQFNSSTEQMMMVILDNDLANVIQAERRQHAARERVSHESIGPARGQAPLLYCRATTTAMHMRKGTIAMSRLRKLFVVAASVTALTAMATSSALAAPAIAGNGTWGAGTTTFGATCGTDTSARDGNTTTGTDADANIGSSCAADTDANTGITWSIVTV